jgi:serine protease Do
MPGETVFAIGNPLGYKHTVTTGIISAVDRELRFSDRVAYKGLIQTDASINPGNSGGPLFNITGELIGINTAIRGDAQNIGFAIPVDRLHELLPEMRDIERLRRVAFGAHFGAVVRDGALQGVRVLEVEAGSPAGKAGLRSGDVIRAVNRHETPNYVDIFSILADASVDKPLAFEIAQGNGRLRTLNIALADVPRPDGINLMRQRFGLGIRELKPSELEALGLRTAIGLVVAEVKAGTQAAREGVESGDLITSIAGRPVNTLDQAGHLLENIHRGDQAAFGVTRIGTDAIIRVELVLKAL